MQAKPFFRTLLSCMSHWLVNEMCSLFSAMQVYARHLNTSVGRFLIGFESCSEFATGAACNCLDSLCFDNVFYSYYEDGRKDYHGK